MNTRIITVVLTVVLVPIASGCGTARNLLFGSGARCGACAATAPGYTVAPPAYGAPAGIPPRCGTPGCGPVTGDRCGCGGEYGGAYYGGYDAEQPGSFIGGSGVQDGFYGGRMIDEYNANNWMPSDPNYVPGTLRMNEGVPMTPMRPVP